MTEGSARRTEFCTLKEVAERLGLDARGVRRLRKHLRWKKVRWKHGRGWLYRVEDMEKAISADRAAQAAETIDSRGACPRCGARLVRLWFVERCAECGAQLKAQ